MVCPAAYPPRDSSISQSRPARRIIVDLRARELSDCDPERICICLDTAHVFAAGYDIGSELAIRKTFREFDRVVGGDRLVAIHVNDSKTARGSRVDRHQHIGQGKIGLDAFRFIMRNGRFKKIPKVLETPKGKDLREDVLNLKTLRALT